MGAPGRARTMLLAVAGDTQGDEILKPIIERILRDAPKCRLLR